MAEVNASLFTPKKDGAITLPEGQKVCRVSIEKTQSINHRVFAISIVVDEQGKPLRLLNSQFYAWATIKSKEFLLTYKDVSLLEELHCAHLANIQKREETQPAEKARPYRWGEIDDSEKRELAMRLEQLGYPPTVDYVKTAKAAMTALTAKDLEQPFRE